MPKSKAPESADPNQHPFASRLEFEFTCQESDAGLVAEVLAAISALHIASGGTGLVIRNIATTTKQGGGTLEMGASS